MSLHAFVDESQRNNTYLLAAVHVDPGDLPRLRKLMQSLLFPGQRELHFKKETPERRYEHMVSTQERLLWIADAAVWAYGAGGDWSRRARQIVTNVLDLDHL